MFNNIGLLKIWHQHDVALQFTIQELEDFLKVPKRRTKKFNETHDYGSQMRFRPLSQNKPGLFWFCLLVLLYHTFSFTQTLRSLPSSSLSLSLTLQLYQINGCFGSTVHHWTVGEGHCGAHPPHGNVASSSKGKLVRNVYTPTPSSLKTGHVQKITPGLKRCLNSSSLHFASCCGQFFESKGQPQVLQMTIYLIFTVKHLHTKLKKVQKSHMNDVFGILYWVQIFLKGKFEVLI
jgi:hypothetical protein